MYDELRSPQTSEEFDEYFRLRWEVLRKPLGLPQGSERDELDDNPATIHAAVFVNPKIVSVGRLHFNSEREGQVRYMATDEAFRGRGFGKDVLAYLELHARAKRADKIVLNAREEAIPFYLKSDYRVVGERFFIDGYPHVAHFKMEKWF